MKKSVLLIGSGGREHALAWKLRQSPDLGRLCVAPGNAGTNEIAENIPIKATEINELLDFAIKNKIDLTVVGPDDPLGLGIVDAFQAKGLKIFGPTRSAAQIEVSKAYSKHLMAAADIPSAEFEVVSDHADAVTIVKSHFITHDDPIVIKASGLALGKGAYVCRDLMEAEQALDEIMVKRVHGSAGDQVVIEQFVEGQEVSAHAFCDGLVFRLCPVAQDHKPIFDNDEGPNTGGMGTIAPVPWFKDQAFVGERIVGPILDALRKSNRPFAGLLYPGLKIFIDGPKVLEFNARFGDPETQVLMRLLDSDLLEIFMACVEGRLHEIDIKWKKAFAACIVMASAGYPSPDYRKGVPITGIDAAELDREVIVFHAGTKMVDHALVTSGGRVLGVTALAPSLDEALERAYLAVDCIIFDGEQHRTDIGRKYRQQVR